MKLRYRRATHSRSGVPIALALLIGAAAPQAQAQLCNAVRAVSAACYDPEVPLEVAVFVDPVDATAAYGIVEAPPADDWTITLVSVVPGPENLCEVSLNDGFLRCLFGDTTPRVITYELVPPAGPGDDSCLDDANNNVISLDGAINELICGDVCVCVCGGTPNSDTDRVPDVCDNCTLVDNFDQRDTDGDGFGNRCDPDFNGDGVVGMPDLRILHGHFGSSNPDCDLDGNGIVDGADSGILVEFFGLAPGPSGI